MCAVFSLIIVNKIDYIISINCKALWNCINKDVISMNVQNTLWLVSLLNLVPICYFQIQLLY